MQCKVEVIRTHQNVRYISLFIYGIAIIVDKKSVQI